MQTPHETSEKENRAEKLRRRLPGVLVLGVILLMLVLNFMTPLVADDFTHSKARSLSEVADATHAYYFNWGGRIVAHAFAFFWGFAGKIFFNFANVFVYCLFVYLMSFHITGKTKFCSRMFLAVSVFLWFFVPAWGQNFLWLTGAVLYFWTAAFILLFLVPFRKKMADDSYKLNAPLSALLFPAGLFAGNSVENSAAAAFFLLVFYFAVKVITKKKIVPFEIIGTVGFMIGFLALVFAPGNEIRQGAISHYGSDDFMVIKRLVGVTLIFGKDLGFALLAVFGILAYDLTRDKKRKINLFAYACAVAALAGAFSMLLSPSFPPRAFLIVTVFAGIALGNVLYQADIKTPAFVKRNFTLIAACCVVALSFSVANTSRSFIGLYMEWNRRVAHIEAEKARGNFDVEVRSPIPAWDKRVAQWNLQDLKYDKDAWPNADAARYYGLNSIRGVPSDDWEVMWFK